MKGKIRVFARIRPLTKTERSNGCDTALTCEDEFSCTLVHRGRSKVFEFDRVFSPASSQAEVSNHGRRWMLLLLVAVARGCTFVVVRLMTVSIARRTCVMLIQTPPRV